MRFLFKFCSETYAVPFELVLVVLRFFSRLFVLKFIRNVYVPCGKKVNNFYRVSNTLSQKYLIAFLK
jgi:hypothetical protein